jgi:hypothetical protein
MTGIAQQYGFRDYHTIWDHPDNEQLKQERVDPHVLYPGDTVVIPDKAPRNESRPTDKSHRFRVASKPLKLRIALKDFDNQPITGTACVLTVDGTVYQLTSDGDGITETPIPKGATGGVLKIPDMDIEHPLKIGFLDPLVEDSGWQGRLVNLGYYAGAVGDNDAEQMRYAIEEFQCDHALKVTGELDGATPAKLKQEHGT